MRGVGVKVFISWSGDTSLKVAQLLRDWLPYVINAIEPYVSSEDIDKGARWSTDIAKELEDSTFGILCVTRDNLNAPWLSFEAGALSKTMEKSFVTPLLFDIKRSEVQGPILQFQSTIIEKDDIKRLLKTLNKACGEASIPDERLDKSFDVWYPTLETGLNQLKNEVAHPADEDSEDDSVHSSEMLEEILELSRDNQKLLKNPDSSLSDDIKQMTSLLQKIAERDTLQRDRRRRNRKYIPELMHDMEHLTGNKPSYGFLMGLAVLRDDFPWIYDMGKELIDTLKKECNPEDKSIAIREFRNLLDLTFNHPIMRDMYLDSKESLMLRKDIFYFLMDYVERLDLD